MKTPNFAMSYRVWIMVLVAVITVILLLAQYFLNYRVVKDLHLQQIEESNNIIVSNVRTMMRFPLTVGDKPEIERLSKSLLEQDLLWAIEVRDANGLIVHREELDTNANGLMLDKKTVAITDNVTLVELVEFGETTQSTENQVGEVSLYFTNQAKLDLQEQTLHARTLISTVVVIVVGLIVFYLILNVSTFVNRAKDRMRLIRHGDYDVKMERSRVRELNEMAEGVEAIAEAFSDRKLELEKQTLAAEEGRRLSEHHSQFKTEMMRLISHELRTPVHVIVNLMGNMDNESFANKVERETKLNMVKQASSELLAVVDELVDMKVFEEGNVSLSPQACDVKSVIDDICERFRPKFAFKPIDFQVKTKEKTLPVTAIFDKGKFERIIANLITNAYKFTTSGKVIVTWTVQTDSNSRLVVSVKDTGVGISKENVQHIFEQFYQVGPIATRQGGMGIGLTWVDKLLSVMNGNITVDSHEGVGSEFTVSIPIELSNKSLAQPAALPVMSQQHDPTALVIDDREDNCLVLKDILEPAGIEVSICLNKADAMKHVHEQRYDFILVDYHMPQHDGQQIAELIRHSENNRQAVIMCVTADATITTQETLTESGLFDGIITKPINRSTFLERLEQTLILKRQLSAFRNT